MRHFERSYVCFQPDFVWITAGGYMVDVWRAWAARYPELRRFEKAVGGLVTDGFFQPGADIFINRTPGRLDLMGGNDDYTGGFVFETTIREAMLAAVQPRADETVVLYNPAAASMGWTDKIEFSLADLIEDDRVKPM